MSVQCQGLPSGLSVSGVLIVVLFLLTGVSLLVLAEPTASQTAIPTATVTATQAVGSAAVVIPVTIQVATPVTTPVTMDLSASAALGLIRQDLAVGRLSQPPGLNAMVRIDEFRRRWPTDMAVVPLAYQWATAYQQQVAYWLETGELAAAASGLEQLWELVPLTQGLDALQQRFDQARLLAEQVAALTAESAALPLATASTLETPVAMLLDYRLLDATVHNEFRSPYEDNSPPLAEFSLDAELVELRDRSIREAMAPLCQAIVDNQASVIVHAEDRVDYRWLTVRITLCVRRINEGFRLRHSYRQHDGAPMISLHPARAESLLPDPEVDHSLDD